jgi:hypothetical protein
LIGGKEVSIFRLPRLLALPLCGIGFPVIGSIGSEPNKAVALAILLGSAFLTGGLYL